MTSRNTIFAAERRVASKKRGFLATVSAAAVLAASALAAPQSAYAQTEAQAAQAPNVEEIVVTGTRIVRNGYEAPTPLTVMNAEDIQRDAPTNISDFINKLPELASSPSPRNSSTSVGDGNAGASNLNLRALGANRTLVLLDGMRVVGSSVNGFYQNGGSVDVSAFPDALVSRVDVVTGGASAAYGSDAMSGVVNFVLDKSFTGIKGSVTGGVTTYGDDRQYLISLTAGTGFAGDRGHFLISGSTNYNQGIPNACQARAWACENWAEMQNPSYTPTNGQPFYLIREHVGDSVDTPGGLINSGPLKGTNFGPGGSTSMFQYGSLNDGFNMVGGQAASNPGGTSLNALGVDSSLDAQLSRQNLFTRASYDVTENVQVFAQYMYSDTKAHTNCCFTFNTWSINSGNPFIPASVQAQMNAMGVTSFQMSTYDTQIGAAGADNDRQLDQFVLGANGKFDAFDSRWSWDFYVERSISREHISERTMEYDNAALAVDVVTNPATGLPVCASTLAAPNNGCVPWNPMGIGVASQAALNYILGHGLLDQKMTQDMVSGTVRGEPFSTWAGPVSLAFGFEHRLESVTGMVSAEDAARAFWQGNYSATIGSYHVNEGFIETVVPLAKDASWAKSLDLNAALRETDYSTSGAVTTWKVGATYAPIDDIHFRATRSRDIRAPNLGELYSAGQTGREVILNPFNGNQTESNLEIKSGNPNLAPEEADSTGVGVVFQPSFLPGFSASFDYYKIDISSAIAVVAPQQTINNCFAGNQIYCSNLVFAGTSITTVHSEPGNAAYAHSSGFDIEASYTKRLAEIVDTWNGTVTARLLATHVIDLTTVTPDGTVNQGAGVMTGGMYPLPTAPRWRYNLTVGYDTDVFSTSWTGRGLSSGIQSSQYIQCTSACPNVAAPYFTIDNNRVPGAFYMDLSFTYHLKTEDKFASDLFLTVENVNNWQPNFAFISFAPVMYDTLGRVFRAGVRFKM